MSNAEIIVATDAEYHGDNRDHDAADVAKSLAVGVLVA